MFDLYQSYWVSDHQRRLYIASTPCLEAPVRFDLYCRWQGQSRRLSTGEAGSIYQASVDAGMQPLTYLNSDAGIAFVQQMVAQQHLSKVS